MCIALYAILTALLLIYSSSVIENYALALLDGEGGWMIVAISWEILPTLWPVLLLLMVLSSALTVLFVRWQNVRSSPQSTGGKGPDRQ